jgi:hypothetical protein
MDYEARREKRWIRGISEMSNLRSGKTVLGECVERDRRQVRSIQGALSVVPKKNGV